MADFVRSPNHTVSAAFTRPADTTPYAAGDVVADSTSAATIIQFPRIAQNDVGCGMIQQVRLVTSANVATKPDLQLFLFDTAPGVVNDNAAFAPTDAEMLRCVAVIAFPTGSFVVGNAGAGAAGNAICDAQNLMIPFNMLAANTNALYGVLVVRNAYVPVSGEVFTFLVTVLD